MMNGIDSFRGIIDRNIPLKITFWSFLACLLLSIIFSIVYASIGCGGYGFDIQCSSYFLENLTECRINSKNYCCGVYGSTPCGSYTNCEEQPSLLTIPKCAGVLITSWVLQVLTLVAMIALIWLFSRARNETMRGEDYGRMENTQVEISQRANNYGFGGQGVQIN